jgi:hypothetical protein
MTKASMDLSVINLCQILAEIKIHLLYQIYYLFIRNQIKKKIISMYLLIEIKYSLILLIQIVMKILKIMNLNRTINKFKHIIK